MTDQHRGDSLGCMGHPCVQTPHLDSIARDGVIFNKAYTTTPSCTPARAAILTGMSPWHHGMLAYGKVAVKYKYELPRMIREAGYYTCGIGKMHWHPQRNLHGFHETIIDESGRVESKGFMSDYRKWFQELAPDKDPDATHIGWNSNRSGSYALPEELHPTYWTGDQAVQKLSTHDFSTPLFLKISFARPHSPYDAPQRFVDLYKNVQIPEPYHGEWTSWYKNYNDRSESPFFGDYGPEIAENARKYYYGNVTFIDEQIGKIISMLKQLGQYENSLIVFTADHGDMLGDHYHWRKTYAYEGSAHIPMILKWPTNFDSNLPKGSTISKVTELRDLLPTFLDIAQQPIPTDIDGISLLNCLRENASPWREYVDLEHGTCYHWKNAWIGLTDGKWKYIYFRSTGKEQLFNLITDPHENSDLAQQSSISQKELNIWRNRLRLHLNERGEKWVKNGKIKHTRRRTTKIYSPLYPKT